MPRPVRRSRTIPSPRGATASASRNHARASSGVGALGATERGVPRPYRPDDGQRVHPAPAAPLWLPLHSCILLLSGRGAAAMTATDADLVAEVERLRAALAETEVREASLAAILGLI